MQVTIIDAGRTESHPAERRDCTVRALAVAAGVTYEVAHDELAKAGRKNGRGIKLASIIGRGKLSRFTFRRVGRSPKTVQRFLKEHPQGRFLCRKSRHAFAIIDGVIYDSSPRRDMERITHAWIVT